MSANYSKLLKEEPDSAIIDFGSAFNYNSKEYSKQFSHSKNEKMYKTIFTYSGYRPEGSGFDEFGKY